MSKEHGFVQTADNQQLATTTSSGQLTIAPGGSTWRIFNAGSSNVFFKVGKGAQTATIPGGVPLANGHVIYMDVGNDWTGFAAITFTGTATVHVTAGHGKG